MDPFTLRCFVAVAREGSFSRAADLLYRTQPAVSLQVRKLEREIGRPLFDRSRRAPVLTDAGRVLLAESADLLDRLEALPGLVAGTGEVPSGTLAIASNLSLIGHFLPPLAVAFHARFPLVRLRLLNRTARGIVRSLAERRGRPRHRIPRRRRPRRGERRARSLPVRAGGPRGRRPRRPARAARGRRRSPKPSPGRWCISRTTWTCVGTSSARSRGGAAWHPLIELPSIESILTFVAAGFGSSILPAFALSATLAEPARWSATWAGPRPRWTYAGTRTVAARCHGPRPRSGTSVEEATMKSDPATIDGQPSRVLESTGVRVAVTELAGHLTARFAAGGRTVDPFFTAPWWNEPLPAQAPPLIRVLRGDFFCLPFGNERAHGRTANEPWTFEGTRADGRAREMSFSMDLGPGEGTVRKRIRVVDGEPIVYQEHLVAGLARPQPLGHHPTLKLPDREGAGIVDMSPPLAGFTPPLPVEDPASGGYSALVPGSEIVDRSRVPAVTRRHDRPDPVPHPERFRGPGVLRERPRRRDFVFSAVSVPSEGWLYFQLKDPRVLAETLLWMSNGGRPYPPWNGGSSRCWASRR